MSLIYLATFLFSLTMGALIMPRIVSISQKKNLMDAPDDRKVHPIPVPRLGGISFLPLTMMSIFLFNILCMTILGAEVKAGDTSTFLRIQCCGMGAMLLFLVGVADDLVGVDYRVKFLAQTAAAALFPLSGLTFGSLFTAIGWIHVPFWVSAPFTVFLVVYITNAINLIDGLDGLASGICIIAFTLYTAIFLYLQHPFLASTCLSVLGVLIVFFVYNIFGGEGSRLQKVFMGDTGSLTLGYFISFLTLYLTRFSGEKVFVFTGSMYAAFAPLVIPLLDVVRVVFLRWRAGVPLFRPDQRHIHHRLLAIGLTPHRATLVLLLLTLGFVALNLTLSIFLRSSWVVLVNLLVWGLIIYCIERRANQVQEGKSSRTERGKVK